MTDASSRIFKLLANPLRRAILSLLVTNTRNVTEIIRALKSEQSLISHHLRLLRQEGFLIAEREGKEMFYRLNPEIIDESDGSFRLSCCQIHLN